MLTRSRPNPKKKNPSLDHLRALAVDALIVPEPEPTRYEEELRKYKRDLPAPYLKGTKETRKPERIGNIRI